MEDRPGFHHLPLAFAGQNIAAAQRIDDALGRVRVLRQEHARLQAERIGTQLFAEQERTEIAFMRERGAATVHGLLDTFDDLHIVRQLNVFRRSRCRSNRHGRLHLSGHEMRPVSRM